METILAGRYHIVKHLGGGGFGQTFLAKDSHLPGSPHCVVKQLQPKVSSPDALEIAKRLFDREAEILYRLGNHDLIPRLLAHFKQGNDFYLVQDYIEGIPLDQEIVPGKQFHESAVIALLQDILEVLAYVHKQQVIHRDIKPANLIRRSHDGKIVLIDFGAVKEVSNQAASIAGHTNMTVAIGSPGYMPAEQQASKPHFSSDIYSVGMVCLQALTGLAPRQFLKDNSTGEIHCALLNIQPPISAELAAILDTMVRYDYRQRYQDGAEALAALQPLLAINQLENNLISTILSPFPLVNPAASPVETQPVPESRPSYLATGLLEIPDDVRKSLERLLAEWIGPIAAPMLKRVLGEAPDLQSLTNQLVDLLPQKHQSQFRERANSLLSSVAATTLPQPPSQAEAPILQTDTVTKLPSSLSDVDPNFIKRCELELTKSIGPIAILIVQRTLTQHSNLSRAQLVDNLAQYLVKAEDAATFRRSLLPSL